MDAVSGSRRRKSAPRRFYGRRDGDLGGGYQLMIKGPAMASRTPSDGWVGTRQELQRSPCESAATAPELHIINGKSRPLFGYTFSTIPYSHSIINEPSKLLIRKALAAAPQTFTVTFTVNLPSTSIGAGLRAIRQNLTFRDLSTSIDSRDGCQRHRHASSSLREAPKKGRHQTP